MGSTTEERAGAGVALPDRARRRWWGDKQEIAAELGCHPTTVGKWRNRFAELGVDGLHDEPRPGKPRTISDDDVERVVVKTPEETPPDATH